MYKQDAPSSTVYLLGVDAHDSDTDNRVIFDKQGGVIRIRTGAKTAVISVSLVSELIEALQDIERFTRI